MKLIYLWIENCKNLHNFSLTFDNRYICSTSYDEQKVKIEIRDNPNKAVKINIFGKNYNIWALAGKNGAGKTAILNTLYDDNINKILVYIKKDGTLFYYTSSELKDRVSVNFNSFPIKPSGNLKIYHYYSADKNTNVPEEIIENLKIVLSKFDQPFSFINNFVDFKNYLYWFNGKKFLDDFFWNNTDINPAAKYFRLNNLTSHDDFFRKNNKEQRPENIGDILSLLLLSDFICWLKEKQKKIPNKFISFFKNFRSNREIYHQIQNYVLEKQLKYPVENLYNKLQKCQKKSLYSENIILEENSIEFYIKENTFFYSKALNQYCQLDFRDPSKHNRLLKNDNAGGTFKTFSSGEQYLITLATELYAKAISYNVILIDEGEMFEHPDWQRNYILFLTKILEKMYKRLPRFRDIIITTHSPFILSDLPQENIIYLENGKIKEDSDRKSFGANIYDLLKNSFFLDAPIGEFAREKINSLAIKISELPKGISLSIEDQALLQEIGEPIIRNKLLSLYTQKINYNKHELIAEYDKKINEMKKELRSLERKIKRKQKCIK